MNVEYFIVQAGGEGTRLERLTRNRPKALVPVDNLPILFHLFRKFPEGKFLVVGDYKYEVLERYLRTFAEADYLLLRAEGKGNAAGLREALRFVPEGEPVCLIWSDLLLSEDFRFPDEAKPCYVGTTGRFPCSWRFEDGRLERWRSERGGVAGCFLFDRKERLDALPEAGSFTTWLAGSGLPLAPMDMGDSREAGTLEALRAIDPGEHRCRPYNRMEFTEDTVTKTGLTPEAVGLIEREVRWYERAMELGFGKIPKIRSFRPLVMERIRGENVFRAELDDAGKRAAIDRLVDALEELHGSAPAAPDWFGLQEDYYTKTLRRLNGIREVIPFAGTPSIRINGRDCKNVFFYEGLLEAAARETLFDTRFGPIHGDCTLTNTMIDTAGNIYFIDARGYFGKREFFGDVYYDWAKLYYSIAGRFDQFNIRHFDLTISDEEVRYEIQESGWEHLTDYFLSRIPDRDLGKIQLIHAIVWLSLASHCWEDYDSLCLAFYNGLYLWNEWLETRGGEKEGRHGF